VTERPIALLTYSTKPRGGVVHTLQLAEALHDLGVEVCVVALGDLSAGFFRPVRVPFVLVPGPVGAADLEEKVAGSIDRLEQGLLELVQGHPGRSCTRRTASAPVRPPGSGMRGTTSRWSARCTTWTTSPARS
jgi:hypothetical protein